LINRAKRIVGCAGRNSFDPGHELNDSQFAIARSLRG
jgi:hypothetical protein